MATKKESTKAVLEMGNEAYKGEGETVEEALKNIPLDYLQVKLKGTITISKDGKTFERYFPVLPLRRLFANKLYKAHWASQVEKFLQ